MTGISRWPWRRASWIALALTACGGGSASRAKRGRALGDARHPAGRGDRARDRRAAAGGHGGHLRRRRAPRHRAPARPAGEHRLRRGDLSRRARSRRQRPSREGRGAPAARRVRARPRHERAVQRRRLRRLQVPPLLLRARQGARDLRQRRAVRARARRSARCWAPDSSSRCFPRPGPPRTTSRAPMPAPGTYLVAAPESTVELRRLRRARPPGRRHGAGDPPGRARRRHAGLRVRQAPPRAVRLPARVARGRRAVGPVHLPRHRPARGVPLPRPRAARAGPRSTGWQRGRDRHRAARASRRPAAPPSAGGRARACRGSPAAPWATSATTSCGPSSRCRTRRPTTATCPTPS